MNEITDRAWPLPSQPWVMRMTWSELLFAHWPIEPDVVASFLPAGVTLDTRDGKAWVGVVPFLMSNIAPRFCPAIPGLSRFPELNVRTYVSVDGKPGVWFFSLDAASRIAVRAARATFNLPYMDAKMSIQRNQAGEINYESRRTHRGGLRRELSSVGRIQCRAAGVARTLAHREILPLQCQPQGMCLSWRD